VKGLYALARAGGLERLTGVTDPYEPPVNPEVVVCTDMEAVDQSAAKVVTALEALGRGSARLAPGASASALGTANAY
jgi:adenylylsulfate kinase